MRRLFPLALLVAPLAVLSARAQERVPPPDYGGGGVALVSGWVHQFLGRGPNHQDIVNGRDIDAGRLDPNDLLPGVLSCGEYYGRAGGNDPGWVQKVYRNVVGRAPTQREMDYWVGRLQNGPPGMDGRTEVAYALLRALPAEPDARTAEFRLPPAV